MRPRVKDSKTIVAGLLPFESARHTDFLANEVPGLRVPTRLIDRMRRTETPDEETAEGIAIAQELAAGLKDLVQGIQLVTASSRIERALHVLEQVSLKVAGLNGVHLMYSRQTAPRGLRAYGA